MDEYERTVYQWASQRWFDVASTWSQYRDYYLREYRKVIERYGYAA